MTLNKGENVPSPGVQGQQRQNNGQRMAQNNQRMQQQPNNHHSTENRLNKGYSNGNDRRFVVVSKNNDHEHRPVSQRYSPPTPPYKPRPPVVHQQTPFVPKIFMQSGVDLPHKVHNNTNLLDLINNNEDRARSNSTSSASAHINPFTQQHPVLHTSNRSALIHLGNRTMLAENSPKTSPNRAVPPPKTNGKSVYANHQPSAGLNGKRMSPGELIRRCDKRSSSETTSPYSYSSEADEVNSVRSVRPSDSPRSGSSMEVRRSSFQSPPSPVTRGSPLEHKAYGEFKLFNGPQQPKPVQLKTKNRQRKGGPTGIPLMDCSNGYRGGYNSARSAASGLLGAPLDHRTMETDFDFDANLAMFDKAKFNRALDLQTEGTGSSQNYRHDENILEDSTRVISWTNSSNRGRNKND